MKEKCIYCPDLTEKPSDALVVKAVGGVGPLLVVPLTVGLLLPEKRPREKIHGTYGQTALRIAHMESIFRL